MSEPDQKLSAAGVIAMAKAQADVPPSIVHTLRVLLDPSQYPPDHVTWVRSGVRAILEHWRHSEDIEQLKADLGLNLPKKRRKELTMRTETEIAAAIVEAALGGDATPKRTVADQLQVETRTVQRAWKTWKSVYLARLDLTACQAPSADSQRIRATIDRLQSLK